MSTPLAVAAELCPSVEPRGQDQNESPWHPAVIRPIGGRQLLCNRELGDAGQRRRREYSENKKERMKTKRKITHQKPHDRYEHKAVCFELNKATTIKLAGADQAICLYGEMR